MPGRAESAIVGPTPVTIVLSPFLARYLLGKLEPIVGVTDDPLLADIAVEVERAVRQAMDEPPRSA